jgi:hypothetical protein
MVAQLYLALWPTPKLLAFAHAQVSTSTVGKTSSTDDDAYTECPKQSSSSSQVINRKLLLEHKLDMRIRRILQINTRRKTWAAAVLDVFHSA